MERAFFTKSGVNGRRLPPTSNVRGQPGGDTQEHRPVRRRTGRLSQNRLRTALVLLRQSLLKGLPGPGMLHIVPGAELPRHIVVADHVLLRVQTELMTQPPSQIHAPLIGGAWSSTTWATPAPRRRPTGITLSPCPLAARQTKERAVLFHFIGKFFRNFFRRRIVSFHEEEGCQLMEFRSRELFLSCVEQYTGKQYRYQ